MGKNPHQLIEGIAIAAIAAGAGRAFIFIRGEYAEVADVLDGAVAEAYGAGYLGADVLGTGHRVELVVHRGAGAYICGEETALLDSLEGKRGNPRLKPPFPAIQGLYGGPTLINNVETLSNVPHIVANGADWFKSFGTEQSPGTKVVSVSGCVQRPGNYEVELGIPSRELIYELAGGPPEGREVKAWFPGGSSAPVLTAAELDLPYSFEAMAEAGSMLGSGSIIVADDTVSIPELALRTARFYHHESCGKCTPCREGTNWTVKMLERVISRRGDPDGPGHHRLGPGEHHRPLPVRARRLDGDAGRQHGARSSATSSRRRSTPGGRQAARRSTIGDRRAPTLGRPRAHSASGSTSSSTASRCRRREGTMLVDAAKHGDVEIPVFCYEPKLGEPVGACRMCLVEIEGIPKLQTACSTPVRDGMVVYTPTDRVKAAQEAVVEFLLVNHPLDCPVCDKGGECPLQDIAMGWGPGSSRSIDPKRHFQKPIPLSPLIKIDRERCILCYRCVRFSQEVAEDEQLQLLERGASTFVGTFDDRPYIAPFHGNIIELCPVGALTSEAYRFRARPWDIEDAGSVCTLCPSQCNVHAYRPRRAHPARPGPRQPRGRRRLAVRQGPVRLPDGRVRASGSPSRWSARAASFARRAGRRRSRRPPRACARPASGRPRSSAARPRTRRATWRSGSSAGRSARRTSTRAPTASDRTATAPAASSARARARPRRSPTSTRPSRSWWSARDPLHAMPILDLRIRKVVRRNGARLAVATDRPTRPRRRRRGDGPLRARLRGRLPRGARGGARAPRLRARAGRARRRRRADRRRAEARLDA